MPPTALEQGPDYGEDLAGAVLLLNTQEDEAEAGNDDEQPKFKILAAVKESVPGPETLRKGHGKGFKSDEDEEDAAETHSGACSSKECVQAGPGGNEVLDHAPWLDSIAAARVACKFSEIRTFVKVAGPAKCYPHAGASG